MSSSVVSHWTKSQKKLLDFERDCEKSELTDKINSLSAKQCEDAGLSLLSMSISSTSTALFGRCCVSVVRSNGQQLLKTFKVGDEVVMYCPKLRGSPDFFSVEGIVSKLLPSSIEIICEELDEGVFDASIRIDLRANDGTYQKYLTVLSELEVSSQPLVNLLFGEKDFQSLTLGNGHNSTTDLSSKQIEFVNPNLNSSQMKAVIGTLKAKQISMIHGPPGTGKTSTVVEVIHQSALRSHRALVCAPSNVAVDNILERLIHDNEAVSLCKGKGSSNKVKMVRLGHPARASQRSARYCLDSLIAHHEGTDIVSDIRTEIEELRKEMLKCSKKNRVKRREIQGEVRLLNKEARKREEGVVKQIMHGVDVVLCTCVTAGSRLLRNVNFDMVIIDEAAQALEVSCWIPMLISTRCVLVGDHKQLPPTVKSSEAAQQGLALTLFERVMRNKAFDVAGLVHLLDTQYRMNSSICHWASLHMYDGQLLSHESVANRTIQDIQRKSGTPVNSTSEPNSVFTAQSDGSAEGAEDSSFEDSRSLPVMLLLDTSGSGMLEEEIGEGSRRNYGEASLVLQHVLYLLNVMEVQPGDVGVITPYSGQLGVLKQIFADQSSLDPRMALVDVKTIDGYQGGEKECVVISMVRSNLRREVGFLGEKRRINVAITRAKVHLALICDVDTCSSDTFISSLLDHVSAEGEHRSVFEVSYAASSLSEAAPTQSLFQSQSGPPAVKLKAKESDARKVRGQGAERGAKDSQSRHFLKGSGAAPSAATVEASRVDRSNELRAVIDAFMASSLSLKVGVVESFKEGEAVGIAILRMQSDIALNTASTNSKSTASILRFPASLNSFCRCMVHELATERSMQHRSVGVPPNRYIEISKDLLPFPTQTHTPDATSPPPPPSVLSIRAGSPSEQYDQQCAVIEEAVPDPVPSSLVTELSVSEAIEQGKVELSVSMSVSLGAEVEGEGDVKEKGELEGKGEEEVEEDAFEEVRRIRAAKFAQSRALPQQAAKAPPPPPPKKRSSGGKAKATFDGAVRAGKVKAAPLVEEEEDMLERIIRDNQSAVRGVQYRVGSVPFPNPHSEDNRRKAVLRKIIEGAEGLRRTGDPEAEEARPKKSPHSKVLKKPPSVGIHRLGAS